MKFIQKTLPVGAFQCNCQILVCPETFETVLVDPGDEADQILKSLTQLEADFKIKLKVKALFHTHAHFDHIGGSRGVKQGLLQNGLGVVPEIYLHREDLFIYQMLKPAGQRFGFSYEDPLPVDQFFEDEQLLKFGSLRFKVIHTPGHSPGGVCFNLHEDHAAGIPEIVFTGDTLFKQSIGRTDLWGANSDQLFASIRNRLLTLDGDTVAWPGHGPMTRIGEEKRSNPFLS